MFQRTCAWYHRYTDAESLFQFFLQGGEGANADTMCRWLGDIAVEQRVRRRRRARPNDQTKTTSAAREAIEADLVASTPKLQCLVCVQFNGSFQEDSGQVCGGAGEYFRSCMWLEIRAGKSNTLQISSPFKEHISRPCWLNEWGGTLYKWLISWKSDQVETLNIWRTVTSDITKWGKWMNNEHT